MLDLFFICLYREVIRRSFSIGMLNCSLNCFISATNEHLETVTDFPVPQILRIWETIIDKSAQYDVYAKSNGLCSSKSHLSVLSTESFILL